MVNFSSTLLLAVGATTALALPHSMLHGAHRHPARAASSKKGLSVIGNKNTDAFAGTSATWCWNWGTDSSNIPQDIEFVPELHDPSTLEDFKTNVLDTVLGGTKQFTYALSFNEIDQCGTGGTCMMSELGTAVSQHKDVMGQLAAKGVKIGSPSVTSAEGDANKGLPALAKWKAECDAQGGCPTDFIQLHWYGLNRDAVTEANALIDYLTNEAPAAIRQMYGKDLPIWLTEFAPYWDLVAMEQSGIQTPFIENVIPRLDAIPQLERYSYFAASPNSLNNADGSLSAAGKAYIS